ncbi:PC3-like endoprotease variant B isoform X2 [Clytia hemisphaerica]|uniref:PC3-like endoprotease variant B isoform X2 n=1 Tax=Clytia hemisphaerica TaxID=252671 RepID=UPI0034D5E009
MEYFYKKGFIGAFKIGNLPGHFHFKHDKISSKRKKREIKKTDLLELENEVQYAIQQKILKRFKRDNQLVFNDPMFQDMWYLENTGQTDGPPGVDLNVMNVWKQGLSGQGIVISVLDDGLDHTHPDLEPNYDRYASCDLNDNDDDPRPRDSDPDNCHGTRCGGEAAAAANNSMCGVGVAYNAKIGGIRMLDGQATDALEASALGFRGNHIDIYINCWGPKDDGKTFGKPGPMAANALRLGAQKGRYGFGSIYVWATGNGGLTDDDCNCDGYTTSIFTISIGCIGNRGLSAYYTEKCSSTLAVTFNGASHKEGTENKVVTTDLYHKCTEEFKGTSASAPLAAGVIALALERNPKLTWRDVQDLIVQTALKTSPLDDGWKVNGAGFHFNHKFGFGRLDATAMVNKAGEWADLKYTLPQHRKCTAASSLERVNIPNNDAKEILAPTVACENTVAKIDRVEHVVLTVSFVHRRRGDVSIDLISPSNTRSEMLSTRKYDDSDEGLDEWHFMTVYCWGENPRGTWKIIIRDNYEQGNGMFSDGSESAPDLEQLEDQVIDSQMKIQANPLYDGTLNSGGLRRDQISRQPNYYGYPAYNYGPINYPYANYDIMNYGRSYIPATPEAGEEGAYYENEEEGHAYLEPMTSEEVEKDEERNARDFVEHAHQTLHKKYSHHAAADDSERTRRDEVDDARKAILDYYTRMNNVKKTTVHSDKYKKVQVQEEETGVPRVQVSAGYQNPKIQCVGDELCSGVLLKWVITFYGSCVSPDCPCVPPDCPAQN